MRDGNQRVCCRAHPARRCGGHDHEFGPMGDSQDGINTTEGCRGRGLPRVGTMPARGGPKRKEGRKEEGTHLQSSGMGACPEPHRWELCVNCHPDCSNYRLERSCIGPVLPYQFIAVMFS